MRLLENTADINQFSFQIRDGFELWSASFYNDSVKTPGFLLLPIDWTEFHDFVIEGIPGVQSNFYIDGELVESTTPFFSNVQSQQIAFGDGDAVPSGSINSFVEISQLNFNQVPIPGAVWLFGSGLIGLVFSRRKLRN